MPMARKEDFHPTYQILASMTKYKCTQQSCLRRGCTSAIPLLHITPRLNLCGSGRAAVHCPCLFSYLRKRQEERLTGAKQCALLISLCALLIITVPCSSHSIPISKHQQILPGCLQRHLLSPLLTKTTEVLEQCPEITSYQGSRKIKKTVQT